MRIIRDCYEPATERKFTGIKRGDRIRIKSIDAPGYDQYLLATVDVDKWNLIYIYDGGRWDAPFPAAATIDVLTEMHNKYGPLDVSRDRGRTWSPLWTETKREPRPLKPGDWVGAAVPHKIVEVDGKYGIVGPIDLRTERASSLDAAGVQELGIWSWDLLETPDEIIAALFPEKGGAPSAK